ncbi:acetyl-coenzyme A transporter 1-like [Panonychus citri]|uniref:acetyl-coenzyme A transporter 1-like n=1 Tax=Panonychus citri TaxID=50023 RepID=UPI0023074FAB|nr:acetyl-coenzyme A transporter 1-like [Panonychus citri]
MVEAHLEWSVDEDNSLTGDYGSIFILLFLYILQGVPLGLSASIPLILQNYKVTYSQQAVFSLYSWPFSLKLIWAPLVDSVYSRRFGHRKSWLIPTQYLIGLVLFLLSFKIDNLLGPLPKDESIAMSNQSVVDIDLIPSSGQTPSVNILAGVFFFLNFLCATQDIAVDGWVLTMLSKRNVVYGSTCNKVGQTIGQSLGYVIFLALQSPDLFNKYLRSTPSDTGIVTLSGFLFFWSIVFLVTNTLVWIFKQEKSQKTDHSTDSGTILGTYLMLIKIMKLKSIQLFVFILLTCQIAFSITTSATSLKLTEAGIPKETLAFLSVPLIPMQMILPWFLSKYTKGPKPLNIFIKSYVFRIICGLIYGLVLFWTKRIYDPVTDSFPVYYYIVNIIVSALHQAAVDIIFVALLAFHARISDPTIGGTYMTLLTTVTNLGTNWPSTVSLWLLDYSTFKHCSIGDSNCDNEEAITFCSASGGKCNTTIDGYYVQLVILTILGLIWLKWARKRIDKIQNLPPKDWKCT